MSLTFPAVGWSIRDSQIEKSLFKETSPACERSQSLEGTWGFVMSDFGHFLQILGEAERQEVNVCLTERSEP